MRYAMKTSFSKTQKGKIGDLLERLRGRKLPIVHEQAGISEIIGAFLKSSHSRILYVVDNNKRLKGLISLGDLVRHVFFHYHDPSIDARSMVIKAVSETAKDFTQRDPLFSLVDEDVDLVLKRMIKHNIKEIPILNAEGKVIGDLTMVDLLDLYNKAG
jgi:CBS domain-containing protein